MAGPGWRDGSGNGGKRGGAEGNGYGADYLGGRLGGGVFKGAEFVKDRLLNLVLTDPVDGGVGEGVLENCPFFKMEEDFYRVADCTTPNFNGIISVTDPTRSWAAKWLRMGRFVPGVYTLAVSEVLSEDLRNLCEDEQVQYVPPKRV